MKMIMALAILAMSTSAFSRCFESEKCVDAIKCTKIGIFNVTLSWVEKTEIICIVRGEEKKYTTKKMQKAQNTYVDMKRCNEGARYVESTNFACDDKD